MQLTMYLFGEIWTLALWVMKAVECFIHCLMDHTSRSMKEVLNVILTFGGSPKRFQRKWILVCSLEIVLMIFWWQKKMAAFALVWKSCLRLKGKKFGLILLTEEISKQSSRDSVMWFLAITLMKIYNEKDQVDLDKSQNENFEEKRSARMWF